MPIAHPLLKPAIQHLETLIEASSSNENLLAIMRDALLCLNLIIRNEPDSKNKFQELTTIRNNIVHIFLIVYSKALLLESLSPEVIEKDIEKRKKFFAVLHQNFNAYLAGSYESLFQNKKILQAKLNLSQLDMLIKFYYALLALEQLPETLATLDDYLVGVYVLAELAPKIEAELPLDDFQDFLGRVTYLRHFLEHEIFKSEIVPQLSECSEWKTYYQFVFDTIQAGFHQPPNKSKKFEFPSEKDALTLQKLKRHIVEEISILLAAQGADVSSNNHQPILVKKLIEKIKELTLCKTEVEEYIEFLKQLPFNQKKTKESQKKELIKKLPIIENFLGFFKQDAGYEVLQAPDRSLFYYNIASIADVINQLNGFLDSWKEFQHKESLLMNQSFENLIESTAEVKNLFRSKSNAEKKILLDEAVNIYFGFILDNLEKQMGDSIKAQALKLKGNLFTIMFDICDAKAIFLNEQKKLLYYLYSINDVRFFAKALEVGALDPNAQIYCDTLAPDPKEDTYLVSVLYHMIKYHYPADWIQLIIQHASFDPNQFSKGEPICFIFAQLSPYTIVNHEIVGKRSFYSETEFVDSILLPFIQHEKFDPEVKGFSDHTLLYRLLDRLTLKDFRLDSPECEALRIKYTHIVFDRLLREKESSIGLLLRDRGYVTIYQKLFEESKFGYFEELFLSFEVQCVYFIKNFSETFDEKKLQKIKNLNEFFAANVRMDFLWPKNQMPVLYQEQESLLKSCCLEVILPSLPDGSFESESKIKLFVSKCESPSVSSAVHQQSYSLIQFFERSAQFKYFYLREYYDSLGMKTGEKIALPIKKLLNETLLRDRITEDQYRFVNRIVPRMQKLEKLMKGALEIADKRQIIIKIQESNLGKDMAFFSVSSHLEKLKTELHQQVAEYENPTKTLSLTKQSKAS